MPRSEGAPVKTISSAPSARTLMLPCPFVEIAPLATTRAAVSMTSSTWDLSIAVFLPTGVLSLARERELRGAFVRLGVIEVEMAEGRDEERHRADHGKGQEPAADDARHGPEDARAEPALERPELVGRTDEHP